MKKIYCFILLFFAGFLVLAKPGAQSKGNYPGNGSLSFRENAGQVTDQSGTPRSDIHFQLNTNNTAVFIGRGKVHYQWNHMEKQATGIPDATKGFPPAATANTYRLDMELIGFDTDAVLLKEAVLPDVDIYYAQGLDGTRVHAYQKVTYQNIYPHIDWVFYIKDNTLKYDFIVHPGGKVSDIQIRYNGANNITINNGAVTAVTPMGSITEEKPFSYNKKDGSTVPSRFMLKGDVLCFEVDNYEGTLVIDPELRLEWGTYYGGTGPESGQFGGYSFNGYYSYSNTVITDNKGNVYMAGTTYSINNIATTGSYQANLSNGNNAFLIKFDAAGQRIWATYFGGYGGYKDGNTGIYIGTVSGRGHSIACDTLGNIYMAGNTRNDSGIATPGAYQINLSGINGWPDLYLVKFTADGNREWATYYGNTRMEEGGSVAVTPDGSKIYFAGAAQGHLPPDDVIASPTALIPSLGGASLHTGFLACFNPQGQRLWGTYLNDNNSMLSTVYDIALDKEEYIYLTGYVVGGTAIPAYSIATPGSFQGQFGGCVSSSFGPPFCPTDAFLQKWDSTGNRLWGTYYGGNQHDGGYGIACDDSGNVYMTGYTNPFTSSINGPYSVASQGSFIDIFPPGGGSFLAKFSGLGQRLWATYYYGTGTSIACHHNNIFLLGNTATDSLATPCAYQTDKNGTASPGTLTSAYITLFTPSGQPEYMTYYGGQDTDEGYSIATGPDEEQIIYLAGITRSATNIATAGSFKNTLGGQQDAFLAKFYIPAEQQVVVPCFSLDSVQIMARDTLGNKYQWNNGTIADRIWVKTSGNYVVSYQQENGCGTQDSFSVTIYPMPELTTTKKCHNEGAAYVSVGERNTNVYTYEWYKESGALLRSIQSDTGDALSGLSAGNYTLRILAAHCDTTLSFTIETFPEVILTASNDTVITAGKSVQLWSAGADLYKWEPERWLDNPVSARPVSTPEEPVLYTVTGFNNYGCKTSLQVRIDIQEALFIPNAFSPNGDGINDEFRIANYGYQQLLEFRVFNRWGEAIFSTTDPTQGWNGTFKQKQADPGVYHYFIRLYTAKKEERVLKGDLTLIR